MVSLGKELRKARIDKSLSQQGLSACTGISQKHISALETDDMMPKWPTLATLAAVLDLDLNRLAREWSHYMTGGTETMRRLHGQASHAGDEVPSNGSR